VVIELARLGDSFERLALWRPTMPGQEPKPENPLWGTLLTAALVGLTTVFIAGAVFSLALIATGERLT
jgi:hypothetical protein